MGDARASRCSHCNAQKVIETDIVVLGAGPAGAISAALAARECARVLLVDPQPTSQNPKIGETLPGDAAQQLENIGLPGPLSCEDHVAISGVVSRWGGDVTVEDAFSQLRPSSWRLVRGVFDGALLQAASKAGATLVRSKAVIARRDQNGFWEVHLDDKRLIKARELVDASGRRGVLGRWLDIPRRRQEPQVAIWAMGASQDPYEPYHTKTLIDAVHDGWWYGANLPNRHPIAALHVSPAKAQTLLGLPKLWRALLAQSTVLGERLDLAAFAQASLCATDASGSRLECLAGSNWRVVGDAAFTFDPLSSYGLANAINSAIWGHAVSQGELCPDTYQSRMGQVWVAYARTRAAHLDRWRRATPFIDHKSVK